ncbi:winged helix-turn-helix domain-containing protein, partial [Sansalvadorimonas verongulae]|uniref:winged helix-turn-helix domain-containing protein n=1 Tax=Sansalvadorimonas verongulae TaxID=2172824 RepID=UPI0018AD139F
MPAVQYILHHEPAITFSPSENRLTLDEEDIHLEPLQARLLEFFIEQQGEVLSTRTIADNVWERNQVSDNLVRQVISLLRGQLKDKTRPYRIIKTIPKKGYLFDLEVSKEQPSAQPEPISEPEPEILEVAVQPAQEVKTAASTPQSSSHPVSKSLMITLLTLLIAG